MNSSILYFSTVLKYAILSSFISFVFLTNLSANTIDVVLVGYEERNDYNDNPLCKLEFAFGNNSWGTMYDLSIDTTTFDDRGDKMKEYTYSEIIAFDSWSNSKRSVAVGEAHTSKSLEIEGKCKYIKDIYLKEVKPEKCNIRMMPEGADCLTIINPISRIDHINLINEFSTVASIDATNPGLEPLYYPSLYDLMGELYVPGGDDPIMKKTLGTNIGREIKIDDLYVWGYNSTRYMAGGPLELWTDDSMGADSRVTCAIKPALGDKFMINKLRQSLQIEGRIKSYNDYEGLIIEPCEVLNELQ